MSSVFIDFRTLSFVLVVFSTLFAFIMFNIRRSHKTYPGFELWAASNLFIAIGFFLVGFRGILPDPVTIIVANTFTIGGLIVAFEGNRRFLELGRSKYFSPAIMIVQFSVITCLTLIDDTNSSLRLIFISVITALVSGCNAVLFKRSSLAKANFSHLFTSVTYLIFCGLMCVRAVFYYVFADVTGSTAPDWLQSVVFLILIIFVIVWTFNYLVLNSERVQNELEVAQVELEKLATTDFLTNTTNKRQFFEISRNEMVRARRYRTPLSLIIFDVDFFKRINDVYGHAAGDRVLVAIAEVCRATLRGTDLLARLGGEEFAVLLPHTSLANARVVAEYLRSAIEDIEVEFSPKKIRTTASFGVSEVSGTDSTMETVLERADTAMYAAKRSGRNQVAVEHVAEKLVLVKSG